MRKIKDGQTVTLMDVKGCGVIRHMWMTISPQKPNTFRNLILRMYWDGEHEPSVEVPVGDFFGMAHGHQVEISSAWTTSPRARGFNCFFAMPFGKQARVTVTNDAGENIGAVYYQIDYELTPSLPANAGRFHAQFRWQNPTTKPQDYVIVDNLSGPGMHVGTVIGIRPLEGDWWGEGEIKFYMDGDERYPTICGSAPRASPSDRKVWWSHRVSPAVAVGRCAAIIRSVRGGTRSPGGFRPQKGSQADRDTLKDIPMKSSRPDPQIVLRDGKPAAVIIGIDEYEELLERAEDAADLKRLRAMRKKPLRFKKLDDFLSEMPKRV